MIADDLTLEEGNKTVNLKALAHQFKLIRLLPSRELRRSARVGLHHRRRSRNFPPLGGEVLYITWRRWVCKDWDGNITRKLALTESLSLNLYFAVRYPELILIINQFSPSLSSLRFSALSIKESLRLRRRPAPSSISSLLGSHRQYWRSEKKKPLNDRELAPAPSSIDSLLDHKLDQANVNTYLL
ncbi:hypothetical protein NE237_006404 [Protea cynaroides]|uniref:Uncharacterized protein n=1 Tax=Protea cynaroides TaxID=273540 RepID=A0A9Q0QVE0_9MAGN|nr:hypothetical protein NE237_006404 [Protea cynaroides]